MRRVESFHPLYIISLFSSSSLSSPFGIKAAVYGRWRRRKGYLWTFLGFPFFFFLGVIISMAFSGFLGRDQRYHLHV